MTQQVKMPEPVAYPPDAWVKEFFGEPDECGFYAFRGDFGNIAYQFQRAAKSSNIITTTQAEAYADARVREALGWQPIETAPQDGTPVLLFARLESAEASTRVVGSFILGEWLAQSYVGQNKAVLVPSHWMPLPPFPPLPGPVEPSKENT